MSLAELPWRGRSGAGPTAGSHCMAAAPPRSRRALCAAERPRRRSREPPTAFPPPPPDHLPLATRRSAEGRNYGNSIRVIWKHDAESRELQGHHPCLCLRLRPPAGSGDKAGRGRRTGTRITFQRLRYGSSAKHTCLLWTRVTALGDSEDFTQLSLLCFRALQRPVLHSRPLEIPLTGTRCSSIREKSCQKSASSAYETAVLSGLDIKVRDLPLSSD